MISIAFLRIYHTYRTITIKVTLVRPRFRVDEVTEQLSAVSEATSRTNRIGVAIKRVLNRLIDANTVCRQARTSDHLLDSYLLL